MRALIVIASVVALVAVATPADAAWSAQGTGAAAARALIMPAGVQPDARASGSDVAVSWPAALLPNGTAVAGYVVRRLDSNGQPVATLADCAATISTTSCVEHGVPAGTWAYVDVPVQASWTGRASPASPAVTVVGSSGA